MREYMKRYRRFRYRRRVRRLLARLDAFAKSLESQAPTPRSREFYAGPACDLRALRQDLSRAVSEGKPRSELAAIAHEIKAVLRHINASAGKGEIPIGRPDLLGNLWKDIYVFQESNYAGVE